MPPRASTTCPLRRCRIVIFTVLSIGHSGKTFGIGVEHTEILAQGGVFIIVDLGSTNTTRVNGERLTTPHKLSPGDWIEIGGAKLVYQEEQ